MSISVGGLLALVGARRIRNRLSFTNIFEPDLDTTLAEETSPALVNLRSLRTEPAVSCCMAAQSSALARRHLHWCREMEAARLEWLCEGGPSRGMEHHIQLAGNGSSKLV